MPLVRTNDHNMQTSNCCLSSHPHLFVISQEMWMSLHLSWEDCGWIITAKKDDIEFIKGRQCAPPGSRFVESKED